MKVGVISDSHGNIQRTAQAATLLEHEGVAALIHAGDIGTSPILIYLAGVFKPLSVPIYAVLGNVDLYGPDWASFPDNLGVKLLGREGHITLGGKGIGVVHGDDDRALDRMIRSEAFDWIFTGHTHQAADRQYGPTRVVNPGALHRAATPSCAVVDLTATTVRSILL